MGQGWVWPTMTGTVFYLNFFIILSNLHIANKCFCAGHVPGVLLDWLEARCQPAPTTQPTEERHLPEGSLQAG